MKIEEFTIEETNIEFYDDYLTENEEELKRRKNDINSLVTYIYNDLSKKDST